jgi:FkbM family methyltransferase
MHHPTKKALKQTNTRYGNMLYIQDDPTIGRALELYGEYCHIEIEAIKSLVTPTSWFVDVGANIGVHTVGVSPYVQRVIAIEPDLDNFDLLVKNCSGCGCANVTTTRLALGNTFQETSTQFNYGKTTLVPGSDVKTARLDMLGLPQVDFVKIDVEGMEIEVLEGMPATLQGFKPDLLIEMQDPTTYSKIYDYLNSFNYYMYWMPVATYNTNNHKKNADNVFGNQHGVVNWICSREKLNTTLQAVVDRDDTVERMIWRRNKNVGDDLKHGE